ncbi:hypothetical protein C4552_01485 [Candidatus Parcubacteria bacterium]|nr:MAG: hypothetical protein C4552_01485 [Candidatus Parcubacteria bacterium]
MHDISENVLAAVNATGVPFEIIEIDPAFSDTAAFCEKYGFTLEQSANTILVAAQKYPKRYAACVVQGMKKLDVNHAVRDLVGGAKLSFASAEETKQLTGMMIGGVTAFGLPPDLPLLIDEPLLALDWIILGAGTRAAKIKIAPRALEKIPNATVAAISTPKTP